MLEFLTIILCASFCLFSLKTYILTLHENHLAEVVLLKGDNVCLSVEIRK